MTLKVSQAQALAWRMRRHLLEPLGGLPVHAVVERLCGVQAQVMSSAELAVRLRSERTEPGVLRAALDDGEVIRTWAMRGALHVLEPVHGAAFLALIAAARSWERPSWQRAFGMTPARIEALKDAVGSALEGRTLTRDELIAAVIAQPGLEDLESGLRSGWGTLLKPLAWQGVLCHGPSQGSRVTFMRPEAASARWAGLPAPDEAAPIAILAYLGTHGPATMDRFSQWLAGGYFGKRQLRAWFEGLGDRLVAVEVDGEPAFVRAEDADELAATRPTSAVRLLGGFDQYVLAPGTGDAVVVPAARRSLVSRQAGWISPVVVSGGVVAGTWEMDQDAVRIAWFPEAGRAPAAALGAEVERLAGIVGRELRHEVSVVAA